MNFTPWSFPRLISGQAEFKSRVNIQIIPTLLDFNDHNVVQTSIANQYYVVNIKPFNIYIPHYNPAIDKIARDMNIVSLPVAILEVGLRSTPTINVIYAPHINTIVLEMK